MFILSFEEERQLAIYHSKLYRRSPWMSQNEAELTARGFSVDEIMDSLIEQVALAEEPEGREELSIDDRLARQEQLEKLQKQIDKAEDAARKEQQSKKQFELYCRAQKYKENLKEIKNG